MKWFYVPPQVFEVSDDESQVRKHLKLEELPSLGVAQAYQAKLEGMGANEKRGMSDNAKFIISLVSVLTFMLGCMIISAFASA